jgi:hypothetical protein
MRWRSPKKFVLDPHGSLKLAAQRTRTSWILGCPPGIRDPLQHH